MRINEWWLYAILFFKWRHQYNKIYLCINLHVPTLALMLLYFLLLAKVTRYKCWAYLCELSMMFAPNCLECVGGLI